MGILNTGIAIADNITKSLGFQPTVYHRAWTGQNGFGTETYTAAPGTARRAVVDLTRKQVTTTTGKLVTVVATVIFLENVPANGAPGRREPIDPRDIITLPDGTTGPILDAPSAVVDGATGVPFFNQVMIGELERA